MDMCMNILIQDSKTGFSANNSLGGLSKQPGVEILSDTVCFQNSTASFHCYGEAVNISALGHVVRF